MMRKMNDLLTASDLTRKQIEYFFEVARKMSPTVRNDQNIPLLQGKTVVNLFFENSTRTRTSFEFATRKLGAIAVNFAASTSSVAKGETLIDTARNIEAMKPHALVVRHACAGAPLFLTKYVTVPVLNAGDGFHEHPTQGLLDAYTIIEKLGSIEGKKIVILGDIAHSRVARSNIHVLRKLGAKVSVSAPPTLLPPKPETLGVEFSYRPEPLLKDADVVMALRIQLERQNKMQIPSIREYSKFWGMNTERASLLKQSCIILHPGPINRGVELDPEVADGPRSVILDQVFNGVVIRMALLAHAVAPTALEAWMKGKNP